MFSAASTPLPGQEGGRQCGCGGRNIRCNSVLLKRTTYFFTALDRSNRRRYQKTRRGAITRSPQPNGAGSEVGCSNTPARRSVATAELRGRDL